MGSIGKLLGGGSKQTQTSSADMRPNFASLPQSIQDAWNYIGTAGLSNAQNLGNFTPAPLTGAEQGALNTLQTPFQPLNQETFNSQLQMFSNPFENQVIGGAWNDLNRANQGILSDIGSRATAAGGFGGTRQAVLEGDANRNLLNSFGDLAGNLRMQNFNTGTQNVLDSFYKNAALSPLYAQNALDAGQVMRDLDMQTKNPQLAALPWLQGLISGTPGGWSQAGGTVTTNSGGNSLFGTLSALGGIGSIFSDRRLKNNIEKVGEKNGFNIYEFEYNGIEGRYRGVMAQEIVESHPDAIIDQNGYMAVNYGMLGLDFAELQNGNIF